MEIKDKINRGLVRIEDMPLRQRPIERFLSHGPDALTDAELLAILIKTGTKNASALNIASSVMALDGRGFGPGFLSTIPLEDLMAIDGIGRVKAVVIKAAIELGRRASRPVINPGETVINCPGDVASFLSEEMQYLEWEEMRIILLNAKNAVVKVIKLGSGKIKSMSFSPRDIFKDAIKYNAAGIILVHNHPSGNTEPSAADIKTTQELERLGKELDVHVVDHVILARKGYKSIRAAMNDFT